MLRREEIARIKEKYPKGTPIRLYSMEGEQAVPPGSRGIVDHVDDIGQIHMKWENGSCLALNLEVDRFEIITQQDDISEKKEQEFIDKVNKILETTDFKLLNMSCNSENTSYERYRRIAEEITTLKEEQIEARRKKKLADSYEQRLKDMDSFLEKQTCQIPEFDNDLVRRLIASIKVVSAEKLIIQFQSGIVMEQEIRYE